MSKLLDIYSNLKKNDSKSLYLFKSGMFYIFLAEDAQKAHSLLNLKLTSFNSKTVKCGFPTTSLDKYANLLKNMNYNLNIIDATDNIKYSVDDYKTNKKAKELLKTISNVDIDNLSITEAYSFIESIKNTAKKILEEA